MADSIKIGSLDISAFKVGSSDCKIYLGNTLLYSGGTTPPTPPTPTLKWVSYSEGDTIPSENVYKTYGFRIPTQTVYDIAENGKDFEIYFYSEEKDQQHHSVSNITFTLYSEGLFFDINGSSQEISYDPSSDEYLEIIFSDYGADYNYNVGYVMYGEQGDTEIVYDFPFDMDLYEEDTPTPQTLQWVTFSAGDTIPQGNVYGFKGDSQTVGNPWSGGILEIGTDSNNCVTFGHGAPTRTSQLKASQSKTPILRAPQFTAYFYLVSNGTPSYINSWEGGLGTFIFSDYASSGVEEYYYEDGTKTVPFDCQLYIYA